MNHFDKKNYLMWYLLHFLNILFSSIFCVTLFFIFAGASLSYYFSGLSFIFFTSLGVLFLNVPQLLLALILYYLRKIVKINIIFELVISMILGIIMSISFGIILDGGFLRGLYGIINSIKTTFTYGYYIPLTISGLIFSIFLNIINKNIKRTNVA